jgi:hypothetical protein
MEVCLADGKATQTSGAADTVHYFSAHLIRLSNGILDSCDDSILHPGHVLISRSSKKSTRRA